MPARMPPFSSVLKSRDVEDPVNLWVHRPLAYLFVRLIYRTSMTPNQVTLLAMVVGFAAAGCWVVGTPTLMVWGGILLWSSAILDGADGILARAKQLTSDMGRALDGTADLAVAAASLIAGFYHLWSKHQDPLHLWIAPIVVGSSILHVYLYDFYKEAYLQMQRADWSGVAEQLDDVEARLARLQVERASWPSLVAATLYRDLIRAQNRVIAWTDPRARRDKLRFTVSEESTAIYRRYNRGPMALWTLVSLCPHTYGMSICAMFDRLDIYLWIRLLGANAVFVVALVWQRLATARTLRDWHDAGAAPVAL